MHENLIRTTSPAARVGGMTRLGLALLAAYAFLGPDPARAQDPSADAALDALIKEIDEDKKPAAKPEEPKKPDAPAAKGDENPKPQAPADDAKPDDKSRPKPRPDELSGKDKDLDALLESLGQTKDEPTAKDERKPPGGPGDEDKDQGSGQGDKDQEKKDPSQGGDRRPRLTDKDKAIDEELEELSGRRRKRNQREEGQGEGSGPMGEIIKEMRDVEKRLGEPDTGDETRGRQQQLVKRLETLIERIRQESQQQSKMTQRQTQQPGGKPGDQPGDQDGNNPGGAPNQRPRKPTDQRSLAGGKDAWGHLPPELRQEMENVSKEDSLPNSQELIRRYYLSVSRGKLNRGE
ncbi:hypothetical protein [Paludisphaera mucosa]|uniref:Uncharacterized protein n=1 Tax=Paludisphaera mucosa TaxID=3030827 RepID=A0ABT6FDA5_9BACT|nr:hypothetical protein [Paludisphaera mucosa]MDG3005534.1 hypothetical protein [Paludisphaera mucosa]